METPILVAFIAAVPPTLAALGVFAQMVRNHKANLGAIQALTVATADMTQKVDEVQTLRQEIAHLKDSLERYRL